MKKLFAMVIVILMFLVPTARAEVTELTVTPENPVKGDTLTLVINGSPYEEVDVRINFERDVPVTDGKYILKMDDVLIPEYPNSFTAITTNVEDMTVAMNIIGWVQIPTTATDGKAELSQSNVFPGTYDAKIFGFAEPGATTVVIEVIAKTSLTLDENGEKWYTYPTSGIPVGDITAKVGGVTRTITISPRDTTAPRIQNTVPIGIVDTLNPTIKANYTDVSDIDLESISLTVDEIDVTHLADISLDGVSYKPSTLVNNTSHGVTLSVSDVRSNTREKTWTFSILLPPTPDLSPPTITTYQPTGLIRTTSAEVLASFFDNKAVDATATELTINGVDVTPDALLSQNSIQYQVIGLQNITQYQISLKVYDYSGNVNHKTWSFNVVLPSSGGIPNPTENKAPVPKISEFGQVIAPQEVTFDATESRDKDGIIIEYKWNIDNTIIKSGIQVNHLFLFPGTHTVQLTVKDNKGKTQSETIEFTVLDQSLYKPVPVTHDKQGIVGLPITFDGTSSYSIGGNIIEYLWIFDDGVQATGVLTTHTYTNSGVYNVSLTVKDSRGASSEKYFEVKINLSVTDGLHTNYQQLPEQSETIVELNATIKTTVTVTTNSSTDVILFEYDDTVFNETKRPKNSLGKIVDVVITDIDSVAWPIYVNREYNETDVIGSEKYLVLFYYMGNEWHQCENTGVDTENNTVWAFMNKEETLGSPTAIGEFEPFDYISITSVTVSPSSVIQNTTLTVTAYLSNTANVPIDTILTLTVNGNPVTNKDIIISPGNYQTNFQLIMETVGAYTIGVNDTSSDVLVEPPDIDLQITEYSVPVTLGEGVIANLSFTVENLGEADSPPSTFSIKLNNSIIHQEQIPVLGTGDSYIVGFKFMLTSPGHSLIETSLELGPGKTLSNPEKTVINSSIQIVPTPPTTNYTIIAAIAVAIAVYLFKERLLSLTQDT